MTQQQRSAGEEMFAALIERSHYLLPDDLVAAVVDDARRIGSLNTAVYLADYEQLVLVPVPGSQPDGLEPLSIDGTLAGRVYRSMEALETDANDLLRLWLPMIDGTERIGVMSLDLAVIDEDARVLGQRLATYTAELIVARNSYGDAFQRLRRRREMTLASEIQWSLLPPLTMSTGQVAVSGWLQPCYDVGGDSFDYALNGSTLHIAIFDAMGHGFVASLLASVAIGSYRHSRRRGLDLVSTYAEMDAVIAEQFGPERFLTAQLAELDWRTGLLRWVNAGHHEPLMLRNGRVVGSLHCEPTLPVGLGGTVTQVAEASLQPEDRLLFYTDGVVEARSASGEFFGDRRLGDFLERQAAAAQPAPETMRRVMLAILDHQEEQLQDDATAVLVEWSGERGVETI